MPISIYGHYGFALLLVPTAAADYLEYERFQLLDHIAPFIDAAVVTREEILITRSGMR